MSIFLSFSLSPFYPLYYVIYAPIIVSSSSLYAFCVRGQHYATLYVNRVIQQSSKSLICIQINRYSITIENANIIHWIEPTCLSIAYQELPHVIYPQGACSMSITNIVYYHQALYSAVSY